MLKALQSMYGRARPPIMLCPAGIPWVGSRSAREADFEIKTRCDVVTGQGGRRQKKQEQDQVVVGD